MSLKLSIELKFLLKQNDCTDLYPQLMHLKTCRVTLGK